MPNQQPQPAATNHQKAKPMEFSSPLEEVTQDDIDFVSSATNLHVKRILCKISFLQKYLTFPQKLDTYPSSFFINTFASINLTITTTGTTNRIIMQPVTKK